VNDVDQVIPEAGEALAVRASASRASAPRIVTVAVIPETSGMPGGTSVIRMRTGTRCASRTQV